MKKITTHLIIYLQIAILMILFFVQINNSIFKGLVIIIIGLFVFCIYKVFEHENSPRLMGKKGSIANYLFIFIVIILTIIVTFQIKPTQDQWLLVQTAQEIRNYNFSAFSKGGYLFRYPFQSGLILFYYILSFVFGESNYLELQFINVIAAVYLIYLLSQFACLLQKGKHEIKNRLCLALILCFPLYIYTLYIYGTLIGFSLGIGALYHLLLFKNDERKKDAIISILLLTLSVAIKPNGKIILVAAILYIYYWMLQKEIKFKEAFVLILGYIIMGYVSNQIIAICIYNITGITLTKGMPMLGWIAMGLSEGGEAPGSYSGFVVNTYIKSGYDYKLTSQYAMQEIISRLHYFGANIKDALRFFIDKTIYQWGDATFDADKILNYGNTIHESSIIYKIVSSSAMNFYAKMYQISVFIGSGLFFLKRRKTIKIEDLMLSVVFIGGFTFHLFWESSPTYTVTYFFLLIPYAVLGFEELAVLIRKHFFKKFNRFENTEHKLIRGISFLMLVLSVILILFAVGVDNNTQLQSIKNGYYTIESCENKNKELALHDNEISFESEGEESLTIALNKETGLYHIRFYPSGKLLAVNKDKQLIDYIDSIVNMEYQDIPDVKYEWSILKSEDNSYFILMDQLALTYDKESDELKLNKIEKDKDQTWILNNK